MNNFPLCIRGHAMTPKNTYARSDGRSECQTCRKLRFAARMKPGSGKRPPPPPSKAQPQWVRVPKYAPDDAIVCLPGPFAMTVHEVLGRLLAQEAGAFAVEERKAIRWLIRAVEASLRGEDRPNWSHLPDEASLAFGEAEARSLGFQSAATPLDNGGG